MNSIRKFWNSGIVGKVVIGGVGLLVLCCVCSIPIAIMNPSTPTSAPTEISSNSLATQVEQPTEIIQSTDTPEPPNTSEPVMTATLQQSTAEVACIFCNLECPASQGVIDFCVADPKLISDQTLLENTLRAYCDFKGGDICKVLVWTDPKYIPSSWPMSDEQVNNEVADYNRNKNTGNDCLKVLSAGQVVYQSDGCD